jgi:hypothetical protein
LARDPAVAAWCASAGAAAALARFQAPRADRLDDLVAALGQVPGPITRALAIARRRERWPAKRYSERTARLAGHAVAVGGHLAVALAVRRANDRRPRVSTRDRTAARVAAEWSLYRDTLLAARRYAEAGEVEHLGQLVGALVGHLHGDLATLCGDAAAASRANHPRHASLGLQASALGRRSVMLATAGLLLQWRLHNRHTASATRRIAASRTSLRRDLPRLGSARRDLTGAAPGTRARLFGRASAVTFEERPNRPRSTVTLQDAACTLVAPFRSLPRRGILAGAAIWADGRVETGGDGRPFLKVDLEGPGQHARTVWEDWLAALARPVYDLHPGTLHMEWDLPAEPHAAGLDLMARLTRTTDRA